MFFLVEVVPEDLRRGSNQGQDGRSEPFVAVDPVDPRRVVVTASRWVAEDITAKDFLFVSGDGGQHWSKQQILPPISSDISCVIGGATRSLYVSRIDASVQGLVAPAPSFKPLVVLQSRDIGSAAPSATQVVAPPDVRADQPLVATTVVAAGPDAGKERVFVYYRHFTANGAPEGVGLLRCDDARAAKPVFAEVVWDQRLMNFPLFGTRLVAHPSDRVYLARYVVGPGSTAGNLLADVVVFRDDHGLRGPQVFADLLDRRDNTPGSHAARGVHVLRSAALGDQDVGDGTGALAVHPLNPDVVFLAYAHDTPQGFALHVCRSINAGLDWTPVHDVPHATNPSLAVLENGEVGLAYQAVDDTVDPKNPLWSSELLRSPDGVDWTAPALPIARFRQRDIAGTHRPYVGDYAALVAVGKVFHGVFCTGDAHTAANFPTAMPFDPSPADPAVKVQINPFYYKVARPEVTKLNLDHGPAAGGTAITITGVSFTGATGVRFGNSAATRVTVVDDTTITATSPPGSGTVPVIVTTPGGVSGAVPRSRFSYDAPPPPPPPKPPAITALEPASGDTIGGTSVQVTGTNLTGATDVSFGAAAARSFAAVDDTTVTAVSPHGRDAVQVTVTTPAGTSEGAAFTYADPLLKMGDSGPEVLRLRRALRGLNTMLDEPTDSFDAPTETAVRRLQGRHGLAQDGEVGDQTWSVLDDDVTLIQAALANLGFYNGEQTGDFDDATRADTETYQAARGLGVDGIVGPKTFQALSDDGQAITRPT